jgi:hypothetical protein
VHCVFMIAKALSLLLADLGSNWISGAMFFLAPGSTSEKTKYVPNGRFGCKSLIG